MAVLVTALVAGPAPSGNAVLGNQSRFNPGLVRIYEQGAYVGTGTLVDRNWVLTAAHVFDADVSRYTSRFGGVDNSQDTEADIRTFDRIVVHRTVPDLALLHLTEPVPPDTPVAQVAATNPFTPTNRTGVIYGWSDENPALAGSHLRYKQIPVVDDDARANKAALSDLFPDAFALMGDAIPFVVPRVMSPGDSGGGFFKTGKLVGMHHVSAMYRRVNATGNLYGDMLSAAYEIPLWPYVAWIQSVINGEGTSSGPPPAHDELRRRRLQQTQTDAAAAPPVTTGPAPTTSPADCDPGDLRCQPDPVTPLGLLVGPSTTNGQVLTGCAGNDTGDTCTFSDIVYAKGTQPTLRLADPPQTGVDATTGHRNVIIWCRTTGTLTTGAPTTTLLRLSFTNTDTDTAGYPPRLRLVGRQPHQRPTPPRQPPQHHRPRPTHPVRELTHAHQDFFQLPA